MPRRSSRKTSSSRTAMTVLAIGGILFATVMLPDLMPNFWSDLFNGQPPLNGGLWLHTDGKDIKNSNGQIVKIRGACFKFIYETGNFRDIAQVKKDIDKAYGWGVRFIRFEQDLNVWMDGGSSSRREYLVKALAHMKTKGNMRAFVSFHAGDDVDLDILMNPDKYIEAWVNLADTFKTQDVLVASAYYNEPVPGSTYRNKMYTLSLKVIDTISAVNPKLLIFVGGYGKASCFTWALNNPDLPNKNIVFVFNEHYHYRQSSWCNIYWGGGDGKSELVDWAKKWFVPLPAPVINMEYGFQSADDPHWRRVCEDMIDVMDTYKVGRIAFVWKVSSNADRTFCLLYSRYTLSKWGEEWRSHLQD